MYSTKLWSVVLLLSLLSAPAWAQESILVWKLNAQAGITSEQITSISGFIASEVTKYSDKNILSEQDIPSPGTCHAGDSGCIVQLGKTQGVSEVLTGDLGKVEDLWILNLRRIDVQSAKTLHRISRQASGALSELVKSLPEAIAEVFRVEQVAKPTPTAALPVSETAPEQETTPLPAPSPVTDNATPSEPSQQREFPMNPYKLAGHATFWPGLGFAVFASIMTGMNKKEADDYNSNFRSGLKADSNKAKTYGGLAIAGWSAAGALLISGIVLWAVSPGDEAWAKQHGLAAGFAPTEDGALLSLGGRW